MALRAPDNDSTREAMVAALAAGLSLGTSGLLFAADSPEYLRAVAIADSLVPAVGGKPVEVAWSLGVRSVAELRSIANRLIADGVAEKGDEVFAAAFTVEAAEARAASALADKSSAKTLAERMLSDVPPEKRAVYEAEIGVIAVLEP